jgi:hypothetical protein
VSERRACKVLGQARAVQRHTPRVRDDEDRLSVEAYPQENGQIDYAVEVEIDRYSTEIDGTKLKAALYGTPAGS